MIKIGTVYGDVIEKGGIKNVTITHNYYTPVEPKHENPTTAPDVTVAEGEEIGKKDEEIFSDLPLARYLSHPEEGETVMAWLRKKVVEAEKPKARLLPLRALYESGHFTGRPDDKEFNLTFGTSISHSSYFHWMGNEMRYEPQDLQNMIDSIPQNP